MHCCTFILGLLATLGACSAGYAAGASALQGQRPPQIIQTIPANFPPGLSGRGVTQGEVRAVLNINAEGRLVDFMVVAYTHQELARELTTLLREWEYKPATIGRDPINSRFEATFSFNDTGSIVSVQQFENPAIFADRNISRNMTLAITPPNLVDRPLTPVNVVQPRHPGRGLGRGVATVEFFVDAEGRPRLPAVLEMSEEAFGHAAVAALQQWRFNPPTRNGRPVTVRVVQEFVFANPPPSA